MLYLFVLSLANVANARSPLNSSNAGRTPYINCLSGGRRTAAAMAGSPPQPPEQGSGGCQTRKTIPANIVAIPVDIVYGTSLVLNIESKAIANRAGQALHSTLVLERHRITELNERRTSRAPTNLVRARFPP